MFNTPFYFQQSPLALALQSTQLISEDLLIQSPGPAQELENKK